MALVTVEVADLSASARAMTHEVADPLSTLVSDALGGILGGGGMAGDDPGGEQWASGYDRIAPAAIQAAEDVINSCYRMSAMLGATARNYASAEAASTARGHRVDPHITAAVAALPPDTYIGLPTGVPSASAGAGSPALPTGWHFIAHHLGGYVWPNGHQDRLRAAAAAWRRSAAAFDDHSTAAAWVELGPMVDNLREGDDIATVAQALSDHLETVARAHRGLAHACSQLASYIDHAHSRVEHELLELAGWTGAIQGVGAVASVVSLGAAEAPTQVGQAARIAKTVTAVIGILKDFVAAVKAVLTEIGPLTDAVADVRAAVAWLKDLRIVQVEVAAVPGLRVYQIARVERAGNEAASTTEVAVDEEAAVENLAVQSEILTKPAVESRKLQNIVNNLYKGVGKDGSVGDGTTSAAIRRELATGEKTGGRMHLQKGDESVRGLENWLRLNPTAPAHDQLVARTLLHDLQDALKEAE